MNKKPENKKEEIEDEVSIPPKEHSDVEHLEEEGVNEEVVDEEGDPQSEGNEESGGNEDKEENWETDLLPEFYKAAKKVGDDLQATDVLFKRNHVLNWLNERYGDSDLWTSE